MKRKLTKKRGNTTSFDKRQQWRLDVLIEPRGADPAPSIIHTLHVLLDPTDWMSELESVKEGVRAILESWHRSEDLEELKRKLGVTGHPKRRRDSTVRSETAIVRSIIAAAMEGRKDAKRVGAARCGCDDMRKMQRAWKNWSSWYLLELERSARNVGPDEQQRIRTVLGILKG